MKKALKNAAARFMKSSSFNCAPFRARSQGRARPDTTLEAEWKKSGNRLPATFSGKRRRLNDRVRIFEWLDPAFVGRWRASAWGETERTSQSHRSDTELVRAAVVRTEDLLRNGAG